MEKRLPSMRLQDCGREGWGRRFCGNHSIFLFWGQTVSFFFFRFWGQRSISYAKISAGTRSDVCSANIQPDAVTTMNPKDCSPIDEPEGRRKGGTFSGLVGTPILGSVLGLPAPPTRRCSLHLAAVASHPSWLTVANNANMAAEIKTTVTVNFAILQGVGCNWKENVPRINSLPEGSLW